MIIDKLKRMNITPVQCFVLAGLLGNISFFILLAIKGPILMEWIGMENDSNCVSLDYFRHVRFAQDLKTVYNNIGEACFPPLAYLIYHIIYRMTCYGPLDGNVFEFAKLPWQTIIYIMYLVFGILLLQDAIQYSSLSRHEKKLVLLTILLSTPMFMGALERGNMILYVIPLLLYAALWKDSESKLKRECALLFIAIAAGLKIYPAILGFLYVKEKRWKEVGRLLIYGILFFFVPFLFMNGLSSIQQLADILLNMMDGDYTGRVQFFLGIISFFGITGKTAKLLNYCFILFLIACIFLSDTYYEQLFFAATFMTLVPGSAFRYTILCFLLPLVILLGSTKRKPEFIDYVRAIMYTAIFSIPTFWGIVTKFRMNYGLYTYTYVERYMYTFVWLLLIIESIHLLYKKVRIAKKVFV